MIGRGLLALAVVTPAGVAAQRPVQQGFAAASDVSLHISVPMGNVRIDTWDRDSINVTGSVGATARIVSGSAAGVGGMKLGVENVDPADTRMPTGDLTVTVPRAAHVWVKMTTGNLDAAHMRGEMNAITVSGTITVADGAGSVSVQTIDANVRIAGIAGDVTATTGGGRLSLARVQGRLVATTVSGAIDLTGTAMPAARLGTIGGSIAVLGTVARGALLDIETHNGPVTLYLDRSAIPALSLTSRAGTVTNGLGLGYVGAGRVVAKSFSGAINVVGVSGIEVRRGIMTP